MSSAVSAGFLTLPSPIDGSPLKSDFEFFIDRAIDSLPICRRRAWVGLLHTVARAGLGPGKGGLRAAFAFAPGGATKRFDVYLEARSTSFS